jgi:hypothetical protein
MITISVIGSTYFDNNLVFSFKFQTIGIYLNEEEAAPQLSLDNYEATSIR